MTNFVFPKNINQYVFNTYLINKKLNFYNKFSNKLFKLCNLDNPPTKFAAPSLPIALNLSFFQDFIYYRRGNIFLI